MKRFRSFWWLLLILPAMLGLMRLRIDLDVLNLLPPQDPAVQGLKAYQEHFADARELIVSVRGRDPEALDRFVQQLKDRLQSETNLVAQVTGQNPMMENPGEVAEIVAYLWFNSPPEEFQSLAARLEPRNLPEIVNEARETLAVSLSPMDIARRSFDPYDLLNVEALMKLTGMEGDAGMFMGSSNDELKLLFVRSRQELPGYKECAEWLSRIREIAAETRKQHGTGEEIIRYTGRPAFVAEIAEGMRNDLQWSVIGTAVLIALLFYAVHRRFRPMLWLLVLLAAVLVATTGIGSLVLGSIHVISLGFAAVLLGLAVDYAVIHYQEALAYPELSVRQIRRAIAPSILWAAITTIAGFLVLNFGGLPGLAQLGTLVGIGIAIAATVMVMAFLPPLFPGRCREDNSRPPKWVSFFSAPVPSGQIAKGGSVSIVVTAALVVCAFGVLGWRFPGVDSSGEALKFQQIDAESALEEVSKLAGMPENPVWVLFEGKTEADVLRKMNHAQAVLDQARDQGVISNSVLPTALWPNDLYQSANRRTAAEIARRKPLLREAALDAGFAPDALLLTDELLRYWDAFAADSAPVWPTNNASQWILKRFAVRAADSWLAMGLVIPAEGRTASAGLVRLSAELGRDDILLSGWPILGRSTLEQVKSRWWLIILPMVFLVLLSLWLAFKRVSEVALSVSVLALSGVLLLGMMSLFDWTWNLLNLMAIPLILGTGVDYGIFMQMGLRREAGNVQKVRASIGRALLLCGGTAIIGFGALAWSGSTGMASLGRVCALGIAINVAVSIFLLPGWWLALHGTTRITGPSSFYGPGLWKVGLVLSRLLPRWVIKLMSRVAADSYRVLNSERQEVVLQNLLPVFEGNREEALRATRALYRRFAAKLLDLWNYENGKSPKVVLADAGRVNELRKAQEAGRGTLLITPHLGNWEVGASLLSEYGMRFVVLTQAEPGSGLTEMRSARRSRWGVETVVVGSDPFAFVEVLRKLQDGAVVALLIDRPLASTSEQVRMFNRPFKISTAPAELARASGCAVHGVVVVQEEDGYRASVLPEFPYDQRKLRDREYRREFLQSIASVFEGEIRKYPEQWYHFVPIWPRQEPGPDPEQIS